MSWVGYYEGTADIKDRGVWKKDEPIQVRVQHLGENRLRISQLPPNGRYFESRGFGFTGEIQNASVVLEESERATYHFSKSGDTIGGLVRIREAEGDGVPYTAYECVFEASKVR